MEAHSDTARRARARARRRTEGSRLHLGHVTPRVLVDAGGRFLDHHLLDWGAALTFYAGISLLPALIIVLAVLGLAGDSALDTLSDNLHADDPGPVRDLALSAVNEVTTSAGNAGAALIVGILGTVWSASSYVGGFLRASGVIHRRTGRYPIWRLRRLQMALTLIVILSISLTALVVVLTGPFAEQLAQLVGVEEVVAHVWDLAKWPLVIAFVLTVFAVLYWAAPDVRSRGFQWLTPGGVVATSAWVVGSLGYALYIGSFSDYNALYGSLGAVIGLLVWLWLSNMAMLYGVELNSELERRLDARTPAREEE